MDDRDLDSFFEVLVAFQNGDLSHSEVTKLEEDLKRDPTRRRLFIDFQRRSTAIAEDFQRQRIALPIDQQRLSGVERQRTRTEAGSRRWIGYSLLAIAATALIAAFYFRAPRQTHTAKQITPVPAASFAKLTYADDATWASGPDQMPSYDGRLVQNVSYRLTAGSARLRMDSGAIVAVAAPAAFRGTDPGTIELISGKIAARTPDKNSELTVRVGSAEIRDVGTAFGVTARPSGHFDLSVFDGSVLIQTPDASGTIRELEFSEGTTVQSDDSIGNPNSSHNAKNYKDIWPLTVGIDDASSIIAFARPGPQQPLHELANNKQLLLIPEQLNKTIHEDFKTRMLFPGASWPDVPTSSTVLKPGEVVSSYLLAYVPENTDGEERHTISGSVSFQKRIRGVMIGGEVLKKSDPLLGLTEINYASMKWRRLEVDWTDQGRVAPDFLRISEDGRTLNFHLHVNVVGLDSIRVLVDEKSAR